MKLQGTLRVASDKSITHRALMLASMATGITRIHNPLWAEDTETTKEVFSYLGIEFFQDDGPLVVNSPGIEAHVNLVETGIFPAGCPTMVLMANNSGTTARLLMGALAGTPLIFTLIGDDSLSQRPMKRIQIPLELMGAQVNLTNDQTLPATITGSSTLQGITYELPVASAQLKSAILLAGLRAHGTTTVIEPVPTRDHTELMLKDFGIKVERKGNGISIEDSQILQTPKEIHIPADISQAAFFMVAALLIPGSRITLREVGVNPTRTGVLDVLEAMGVRVELENHQLFGQELVADITVDYTENLQATEISGDLIPRLIDEIPILALLATKINGTTVIKDAAELKVKESNRLSQTVHLLQQLGADVTETADGMVIEGNPNLTFASSEPLNSVGDHRLAMMLMVANLASTADLIIQGKEAITVSYPDFEKDLKALVVKGDDLVDRLINKLLKS